MHCSWGRVDVLNSTEIEYREDTLWLEDGDFRFRLEPFGIRVQLDKRLVLWFSLPKGEDSYEECIDSAQCLAVYVRGNKRYHSIYTYKLTSEDQFSFDRVKGSYRVGAPYLGSEILPILLKLRRYFGEALPYAPTHYAVWRILSRFKESDLVSDSSRFSLIEPFHKEEDFRETVLALGGRLKLNVALSVVEGLPATYRMDFSK